MKILEVIAATTSPNCATQLSTENLIELAKSSICKPLTLNFDYDTLIGIVTEAYVVDDKLTLHIKMVMDIYGMYVVPGFVFERLNDDSISGLEAKCYGVVFSPDEKDLPIVDERCLVSDDGEPMRFL